MENALPPLASIPSIVLIAPKDADVKVADVVRYLNDHQGASSSPIEALRNALGNSRAPKELWGARVSMEAGAAEAERVLRTAIEIASAHGWTPFKGNGVSAIIENINGLIRTIPAEQGTGLQTNSNHFAQNAPSIQIVNPPALNDFEAPLAGTAEIAATHIAELR